VINSINLTRSLIRFDTVNPPGNEGQSALFLADLLEKAGFRVERHAFGPNRLNIVARRGRHCDVGADCTAPPICFTGHLDTVPLGNATWKFDPFAGEVIEGRLYGRGASDMKSGVAAMVAAAINVGSALDGGPGVVLVLTSGEETGCEGAAHLLSQHELGNMGAVVVGEPTGNAPRSGHKGALWMVATCSGQTAHGSMPELGVNAIFRSIKLIAKLQDHDFNIKPHEGLGSPTLNVGRMSSGMNVNSVPDHAEISIDVRTIPGMRHRDVMTYFSHYLAPELETLVPLVDLESVWTDAGDPWLQRVLQLASLAGGPSDLIGLPFFTDASVLAPSVGSPPVLILGPGETEQAHQTDEYCFVDKIPQAETIYASIMLDWQEQHRQQQHEQVIEENVEALANNGGLSA
jgi:succinyl-diaminopimelate desuccinylase